MPFPHFDPVLLHLGPLQVRWYGLMYVLGFIAAILLVNHQIRKKNITDLARHYENLNFMLIISMIIGGRLGYVFFYNFSYYLANPLEIPATWHGGMSFHGGLIGILTGGFVFCRRYKLNFLQTTDIYVVTIPIGLGLGRLGNFINGELFGRTTAVPWGMIFPGGGPLPRHPSQLYEAFLEGLVLFIVLWQMRSVQQKKNLPDGTLLGLFLLLYGLFRSFGELFREPDAHLGFIVASLTMGQLLSICMICAGAGLLLIKRTPIIAINKR